MSAEGNVSPAKAKGGAIAAFGIVLTVVTMSAFAGGWLLGGRHSVLHSVAPTRDGVAYVLSAPCSDGSCQSLWVGPAGGSARRLETLSGDGETCDEIAWTPDGGKVAFLVNGYQLRLFDAHTGAALGAVSLILPDGYPTSRLARGVTFSANGAAVTFDDCPRDHSGCKPALLALK
jgi:WD40 repeat protein